MAEEFAALQRKLGPALAANTQGSTTDHVMIALPSYSVSESLLSHYGDRIPSLEHRYLNAIVVAGRIESCEVVYVSTRAPLPEIVRYYLDLLPADRRASAGQRIRVIEVADDGTSRSVAARMADRPDLVALVREHIGDRPAFIEPWNVTEHEVRLALALDVPINGTAPELRPLAFKSAGRRLFATAGVPMPLGREDVRTTDDVVDAVRFIGRQRPLLGGVVLKHDDSGAGDGNVVLDLRRMHHADDPEAWLREQVDGLSAWYRNDLLLGGVVEERIAGERFSSPSAQVDIRPDGEVRVLATHEQVLGGEGGQVYLGCRFPADPAYAPALAEHAAKVGRELAAKGALGRFSVDFVTAVPPGESGWDVYAIEVNLRKGGTTHPYAALRNLVPGRYDAVLGQWIAADGSTRAYTSTDNLVHESWLGLDPLDVIDWVARDGLQFDAVTKVGTVLHMLSGLGVDGRFGVTAIAPTPAAADEMYEAVRRVVQRLADRRATDREPSPAWPEAGGEG
jgi:hypothetical protein